MVGEDDGCVCRPLDVVSPLFQGPNDGQQLPVVDLIVSLRWGEHFRNEGTWVAVSIGVQLG